MAASRKDARRRTAEIVRRETRGRALEVREIDWVRTGHMLLTLVRVLRGDDVAPDTAREQLRAQQLHGTMDSILRNAVGCTRREDCACPLHPPQRKPHAAE